MEFHRPKPWHGLREFLKEYGIVVLGVFTALAAEQGIEWLHVRADIRETREALRAETSQNVSLALLVAAQDRCLLTLDDHFLAWALGGARPYSPRRPVYPALQSAVWDSTKNGAVARMPLTERLGWARVYTALGAVSSGIATQRQVGLEVQALTTLKTLESAQAQRLVEIINKVEPVDREEIDAAEHLVHLASAVAVGPAPVSAATRGEIGTYCRILGGPRPSL